VRTIGWNDGLNAPFWFSEVSTLYIEKILRERTWWSHWTASLKSYQVGWAHDSAIMFPVLLTVQGVLGPRFHLQVLVGAFFGVTAVLLAWLLGRVTHSRAFGLLFAAMVAASPLQIVWSRVGGIYIGSIPHVLLTVLCGFLAGKRRSVAWAVVTALAVWASVYHYYAARVAVPLAFAAMIAGSFSSRVSLRRTVGLLLVSLGTLILIFLISRPPSVVGMAWPSFSGYAGNKGERTWREFVSQNAEPMRAELGKSLARYFLSERAGTEPADPRFKWGLQFGGLCLLPVTVLGLIGLLHAIRRPRSGWLWIAMAACGLSLPMLSVTTARRLLVFDIAWCALAAQGILVVLDSQPARILSLRVLRAGLIGTVAGITGWSFGAMAILNAVAGEGVPQRIPFGDSGFMDALMCKRCLKAGYEWQKDIGANGVVVLVDGDLYREHPNSPAGLPLYGKLAALSMGKRGNFLEFYVMMSNLDRTRGPESGRVFESSQSSFATELFRRIDDAKPDRIIWHFERPTQWELWLIGRLTAAGGTVATFDTALSKTAGVRVTTEWARRDEVSDIIHGLEERDDQLRSSPWFREIGALTYPFSILHVSAPGGSEDGEPPDWLVASWNVARYGDSTLKVGLPVGASLERGKGERPFRLHLLSQLSQYTVHELPTHTKMEVPVRLNGAQGLDCAARLGSAWWVLNPFDGTLSTTDPRPWRPPGRWTGITTTAAGELVLASASQWVSVFDVPNQKEVKRFAASVWPSLRMTTDECSQIVAGDGWFATFNHMTSLLTAYDGDGVRIGTSRLDTVLKRRLGIEVSIAAAGSYLGVASDGVVRTFEVEVAPQCRAPKRLASRRVTMRSAGGFLDRSVQHRRLRLEPG
jgi:hypothetical protein